jgi:hypothetical protein
MEQNSITVDIAHLSFSIETTEEVSLVKIYKNKPYGEIPDAYAVSWSEWIGNGTMVAAEEEQIYKVKKFQEFPVYEAARKFFLDKVDIISSRYKEELK